LQKRVQQRSAQAALILDNSQLFKSRLRSNFCQEDKMKSLMLTVFLILSLPGVFAHEAPDEQAIIKSIDDLDLPPHAFEASEEALPFQYLYELIENSNFIDFTILPEAQVRDLFEKFKINRNARNRVAGGKCSSRRRYIQNYLKKLNIISGKLFINCPARNGHMRLIDQVTGHRYTFANFHDVNLVAVASGGYQVMDVQFEASPLSLSSYLAEIEASQKLMPLSSRTRNTKGYCYWSISR
jgi:hypothetical protein